MAKATSTKTTTHVDAQALWDDLMKIAEFTDADQPYTRPAFSQLHVQAREWLQTRFTEAGLDVHMDAAGNLVGRLVGTEKGAGTILVGSHSDTVPGGGRFDGVAGVIAALEIARAIQRSGAKLKHNLEIIDFLAEEMNPWGLSCVGSRAIAGELDQNLLEYTDTTGETLGQAINRIGGIPQRIKNSKRHDIRGFFELHIEQGPVLENEKIDIGLVTAIVGITRLELFFRGEADHAGTTPMDVRKDAVAAAAETMVAVRKLAEKYSESEHYFVATIGVVEVVPGAANVIPEKVRIVVDARSDNRELMLKFLEEVDAAARPAAESLRVEYEGYNKLSDTLPAWCDEKLRTLLGDCAKDLGFSTRELPSGAGHDAAFVSRVAPAAMVFVPCLKGKSHTSQEFAEADALAAGAATIAEAIIRLDDQLG